MSSLSDTDLCPCGSQQDHAQCCGPIISGQHHAETPTALLRARYTAFVRQEIGDFLHDSLTAEKQAQFDRREVELSARDAEGRGLHIRAVTGGGAEDQQGSVEYIAHFHIRGQDHAHHERAFFVRQGDRWLYADAEVNPKGTPVSSSKVGRNDPCPCGSGKKYKKCCGG